MRTSKSQGPFQLHALKTAKVSEISEATAAVNIADNEKINFHIGNPLQDERLVEFYFSLCTGKPLSVLNSEPADDENSVDQNKLSFIYNTIKNAVPYTARGGFTPGKIKHSSSPIL